jgi:hypothetical protein
VNGCLILAVLVAIPLTAQKRDFLTVDEADQIRLAQEPNVRLGLYAKFAQQRLDLLTQLLATEKPGRTALAHNTLEDYTHIIEAIDLVAEDALRRGFDIQEGMTAVAAAQKDMLAILRKIQDNPPPDVRRYEFVLEQAIFTTEDSIEMAAEDLEERKAAAAAKRDRERKELEAMMQPKDLEEKRAAEKKATEQEQKKKAPTLRRKGEVIPKKQ